MERRLGIREMSMSKVNVSNQPPLFSPFLSYETQQPSGKDCYALSCVPSPASWLSHLLNSGDPCSLKEE